MKYAFLRLQLFVAAPFYHRYPSFHSVAIGRISTISSNTASTVASVLFRASPIDPALHSTSSAPKSRELSDYNSTASPVDPQSVSRQTITSPVTGISSTVAASTEYSGSLPDLGSGVKSNGNGSGGFPGCSSIPQSLPGLSALASVASAPTSNLRYV